MKWWSLLFLMLLTLFSPLPHLLLFLLHHSVCITLIRGLEAVAGPILSSFSPFLLYPIVHLGSSHLISPYCPPLSLSAWTVRLSALSPLAEERKKRKDGKNIFHLNFFLFLSLCRPSSFFPFFQSLSVLKKVKPFKTVRTQFLSLFSFQRCFV